MTLTEVAELTHLTRATARRILLTLQHVGYVRSDGRRFSLTARVLDIGYAYLSGLPFARVVQPHMETLVEKVGESSSASVLEDSDIVYVARVPTRRIMTISLGLGSRLPAYCTSMGRVLLAGLGPTELDNVLGQTTFRSLTPYTVTGEAALRRTLADVRAQGWALVDQELEEGVRSVAAPVRDGTGRTLAAVNVSAHAGRVSMEDVRTRILPELLEATHAINLELARRGLN